MEIFVFVRMNGQRDDIVIRLLGGDASLAGRLASFDAGQARTYHMRDRQKLWAVIETAFGTFGPFNRLVRSIFADKLTKANVPKDIPLFMPRPQVQVQMREAPTQDTTQQLV